MQSAADNTKRFTGKPKSPGGGTYRRTGCSLPFQFRCHQREHDLRFSVGVIVASIYQLQIIPKAANSPITTHKEPLSSCQVVILVHVKHTAMVLELRLNKERAFVGCVP
jgi:hypothetical protein